MPLPNALRLLATAIFLSATPPAMAKDDCPRATMILNGSGAIEVFQYTAQMVMEKASGSGYYGKWTATQWTSTQTIAPNTPPIILGALAQAMIAAASVPIPGIDANCINSVEGGDTIRMHCTGAFDMFIHPDGAITPVGGNDHLGKMNYNALSDNYTITLTANPLNPMPDGYISGSISGKDNISFTPEITMDHYLGTDLDNGPYAVKNSDGARYVVTIGAKPFSQEAASNLRASATYIGNAAPSSVQLRSYRDGPDIQVEIVLKGKAAARAEIFKGLSITTETQLGNCPFSVTWGPDVLLFLLANANLKP